MCMFLDVFMIMLMAEGANALSVFFCATIPKTVNTSVHRLYKIDDRSSNDPDKDNKTYSTKLI